MRKYSLFWRIYRNYLGLILLSLAALVWFANKTLRQAYYGRVEGELKSMDALLLRQITDENLPLDAAHVDKLCKNLGNREFAIRMTVILASGDVIGDSFVDPAEMDNHRDRTEVMQALDGNTSVVVRHSYTLSQRLLYVAVPLVRDKKIAGVVRAAMPEAAILKSLKPVYNRLVWGGLGLVLLSAIAGMFIPRRMRRQLADMRLHTQRFAEGFLEYKLPVPDSEEMGELAIALNDMATRLNGRILTAVRQRNEQEAILSSMVEGVLAIDPTGRIISLNQAAGRMLEIKSDKVSDRSIHELVRNTDLLDFVEQTLSSPQGVEGDIILHNEGRRFLQAHGMGLRDLRGEEIGAVVVLNDVTRIRRLETIRRDFVANVSHELKTPITSIKGVLEMLAEGVLDEPQEAERFLKTAMKQADRLNAIINDLLLLAKIEEDSERASIALMEANIKEVLQAAIQTCELAAAEKEINLSLSCQEDIRAKINPPLLEQAVVNLIDNAIKYSEPHRPVEIGAERQEGEIVISVRDRGCGIAKEHLERIFERFYRVDMSRSRKLGGTGLGLSIVKHISQTHRGYVTVESTPSTGSAFYIHLPCS